MANGPARDDDDISILIRAAAVSTGQGIKKYYLFRIAAKPATNGRRFRCFGLSQKNA
ncbi:hypothetical protein HRR99_12875 [Agrobacterium vaccinii]|uniref:hypothetical protein n=1 Tax=Agrobacterium vaccinii TaxID=2735528 RepID=UPI001E4AC3F2|nr:hypothetical protein [Agrobacterium vaccinii]UHS57577.1 hypothetical protein HRS00_12515 [Agrobacterium vaccinii]UHS62354.1 hypothetical protein HRR99_12875 [Agrobacterium vaccinii]